jgi:hypothetical protein
MDDTTRQYLSSIGKKGGSSTSEAKAKAARENVARAREIKKIKE